MMTIKAIKEEARRKLALNMHQAIILYTVEFCIFITLIALVVMSAVCLRMSFAASLVMICYGSVLAIIAVIGSGIVNFAMVDFYLATYRCKPYNVRRLGDTLARSGMTKIFLISLKRTLLSFLLLICLIVPGVIYMIRTSMANYLLIANPKMTASQAISASNKVMSGKTGAYFALCMSLFGWYLLGVLSLGLGFIFILPYTNLIKAVYYKRNLQGDKTVYQIVPQPVSPMPAQQGMPGQTVAATEINTEMAQHGQPVRPVPIGGEGEGNEMLDIDSAMRDYNGGEEMNVEEVAISPVGSKPSGKSAPPAPEQEVPAQPQEVNGELQGTNFVESERELTTMEISAAQEAKKQAIDAMYSRQSQKAKVDFFGAVMNMEDDGTDDFLTGELDEPAAEEQPAVEAQPVEPIVEAEAHVAEPVIEQPAEQAEGADEEEVPVISDSEFDDFLRNFDSDLVEEVKAEAPAQEVVVEPEAPAPEPPAEEPVRPAARPAPTHKPADRERRSQVTAAEIAARAERIKREREERQKNNGK